MRPHQRLATKTKLILAFVGFSAVLNLIFCLIAAYWFRNIQYERVDNLLSTEAIGIGTALSAYSSQGEPTTDADRQALKNADFSRFLASFLARRSNTPRALETAILLTDSNGTLVSASVQAFNISPDVITTQAAFIRHKKDIGDALFLYSLRYGEFTYRILETPLAFDGAFVGTLYLSRILDPVLRASSDFMLLAGALLLLCILTNSVGAILLATRILNPVRRMSEAMNLVSENELGARLDPLEGNDELSTLAVTFNHTLDRIEKAYRSQEQLVSDLSHQLRTPLTSMRGGVELGMQKARSIGDYQAILQNNIVEIDRITSLLNTMLTFAKLDGIDSLRYTPCDLPKLLEETIGELGPLWEEKSIQFDHCYRFYRNHRIEEFKAKNTLAPPLPQSLAGLFVIDADVLRFKQAIINILDNAFKYTPHGGIINFELYREVTGDARICRLVIMNSGPSIPSGDLEWLFTPFFRQQASQAETESQMPDADDAKTKSFGLGLNICRRIIALHRGKIRAFNPVTGGAAFEIILPITQTDRIRYDIPEPFRIDGPYDGVH